MGYMTAFGPVDRANLNTGCPGGPPLSGVPFTLEVDTLLQYLVFLCRNDICSQVKLNSPRDGPEKFGDWIVDMYFI